MNTPTPTQNRVHAQIVALCVRGDVLDALATADRQADKDDTYRTKFGEWEVIHEQPVLYAQMPWPYSMTGVGDLKRHRHECVCKECWDRRTP